MLSKKIETVKNADQTSVAKTTEPKTTAYHAPELFPVGKAIDLVQGGSGNFADNNRGRQY